MRPLPSERNKDVPIYFDVEQDMTTIIAPRTLVPGIGVVPASSGNGGNGNGGSTFPPVVTTFPTNIIPAPVVTVTPSQADYSDRSIRRN